VPAAKTLRDLASARLPEARPVGRPFLKWAGGKGQLLAQFERFYPRRGEVKRYLEPFLGGGAVFFHVDAVVQPARVFLSDSNQELIEAFEAVRDEPEKVIAQLEKHRVQHSKEHFYKVRDKAGSRSAVDRASRMIYLNKACFNGLYRVNSRGLFNVPFGRNVNPSIYDRESLLAASASLQHADLRVAPFTKVLDVAHPGDFVYFDPPYVPLSKTSYFTAYTRGAFGPKEQERLAEVYAELADRGCKVMLSNSNAPVVHELYERFEIHRVSARRNINSKADGRGEISEVVVLNYKPGQ
jgi:DNA adenine methylase